jgi:glutathione S-transferase
MVELLGAHYSPWTEKARWALEIRGIPYTFRQYAPLIGEVGLRRKLGRWRGNVSVPVLTDEHGRAIADSAAIARWADGRGAGPRLFPAGQEAAVERFVALSERGLSAGRALSLRRVADDPTAASELVPRRLRKIPGATWLGTLGVKRTLRKYGGHRGDVASHGADLAGVLDELRAALAGRRFLVGDELTFADLAMAQVLSFVTPPPSLRLGPNSRRNYGNPDLAERYPDLLQWRDQLHAAHRPPR